MVRGLEARGRPSTENGLELLLEELKGVLLEGLMLEGLMLEGLMLEGLMSEGHLMLVGLLMLEGLLLLEVGSRVTKISPDWSKQLPNRKVNFII